MAITRRFQATAELGTGTQLLEWDSVNVVTVSTTKFKTGAASFTFRINDWMRKTFTDTAQVRGGFHLNHNGPTAGDVPRLLSFLNGGSVVADVRWNEPTNMIQIYVNAVMVAEAAPGALVSVDTWFHCGFDVFLDASGWVKFYVDGTLIVGYEGNTSGAGTVINVMQIGSSTTNQFWETRSYADNVYLDDSTGEVTFAIPPALEFLRYAVAGNGTASQFTGNDADSTDNYLLVDDFPHDSDTTYVEAASSGLRDLYDTAAFTLPAGYAVAAVIPFVVARKTDAGVATTLKLLAKNGGDESLSAAQDLGVSYALQWVRNTAQPDATAWDEASVNAAEYGIESAGAYA